MNFSSGTTTGFTAAIGALGGVMLGHFASVLLDLPKSEHGPISVYIGAAGGLVGAFIGGTIVGPTSPVPGAPGVAGAPHMPPLPAHWPQ
jgi:hypothetical protein